MGITTNLFNTFSSDFSLAQILVHTIYCHDCRRQTPESIPFLSHPKSRITKLLEKTIVDYRSCMSTLAISRYFCLDWHTVRDAQMRYLEKEYGNVSCKGVTAIGIDEIMVGHTPSGQQHYKTIVRDLTSGSVLWVGDGKGEAAGRGASQWRKWQEIRPICSMAN